MYVSMYVSMCVSMCVSSLTDDSSFARFRFCRIVGLFGYKSMSKSTKICCGNKNIVYLHLKRSLNTDYLLNW